MQAYKLEVQEVAHVTDALSSVDLVAATSSEDIAIGLQQSANSASLAGVEFEKLVGYLAAVQETTQKSAQVVGTSMKSIFSRMQNVKAGKFLDDEGEAINDVEKVLSSLGIELRKNQKEWNSVGDVLDQVNERWDEFTTTEKNAIATSIAGTHQREQFLALMNSYDSALEYEKVALESNGSAAEKYSIYLESLEAAQNKVTASFENFVYNESTVQTYTTVLNMINSIVNLLNSLNISVDKLAIFAVLFKGAKQLGLLNKNFENLKKHSTSIVSSLDKFHESMSQLWNSVDKGKGKIKGFADNLKNNKTTVQAASTAFQNLKTSIALATKEIAIMFAEIAVTQLVLTVMISILSSLTTANTKVKDSIEEATNAYEEQTDKVSDLESKIQELDSSWKPKTDDINGEADAMENLTLETAEYIKQLKQQYEIEKQQQEILGREKGIKQFSGKQTQYTGGIIFGLGSNIEDASKISDEFTTATEEAIEKFIELDRLGNSTFTQLSNSITRSKSEMFQFNAAVDAGDYTSAFEAAKTGIEENTNVLQKLYQEQEKLDTSTSDGRSEYQKYATAIEATNAMIKEQWQQIQQVNTVLESQDEAFKDTQEYENMANAISDVKEEMMSLGYYIPNVTDDINEQETAIASLSDVYSALQQTTDLAKTAWSEMNSQGFLSIDTVLKMLEAGEDYIDMLAIENNMYVLKAGSAEKFYELQKQQTIESLQNKKLEIEADRATLASQIQLYNANIENSKNNVIAQQNVSKATIEAMQNIANASMFVQKAMGAVVTSFGENVKGTISKSQEAMQTIAALGGIEKAENQLKQYDEQLKQLDQQINFIKNSSIDYGESLGDMGDSASGAADATSDLEKATEKLQKQIDEANDKLDDMNDKFDEMKKAYELFRDAIVDILDEELDALEKEQEAIDELGNAFEVVKDMVNEFYDDEIDKINDEIDAIEDQADKELAVIDAKIEALQREKDAQDQLTEIEEARLEVEKAQMALDKLKGQKTQRVYRSGEGWTYEVDTEAIKDAEEELADAQKEYSDLLKDWNFDNIIEGLEQLQEAIEESRDKTVEALEAKIEQLEKEQEAWEDALDFENKEIKNHAQVLAWLERYEKADYDTRMKMLKDFNNKYEIEVIDANNTIQTQIDQLEDLKEQWEKSLDIEEDVSQYEGFVDGLEKFENGSYEERKNMLANFTSKYQSEYKKQEQAIQNLEKHIESMEKEMEKLKDAAEDAESATGSLASSVGDLAGSYDIKFKSNVDEVEDEVEDLAEKLKKLTQGAFDIVIDATTSAISKNKKYATGGLGNFSGSGVVSRTGRVGNNYVDGTPSYSELMLNANDASRVWRWVQSLPMPTSMPTKNLQSNTGDTFNISNLQITANNNSTFERLLKEARNLSINMKNK